MTMCSTRQGHEAFRDVMIFPENKSFLIREAFSFTTRPNTLISTSIISLPILIWHKRILNLFQPLKIYENKDRTEWSPSLYNIYKNIVPPEDSRKLYS